MVLRTADGAFAVPGLAICSGNQDATVQTWLEVPMVTPWQSPGNPLLDRFDRCEAGLPLGCLPDPEPFGSRYQAPLVFISFGNKFRHQHRAAGGIQGNKGKIG